MYKRSFPAWLAILCLLASASAFAGDSVVVNEERVTVFSRQEANVWKLTFRSLDDWIARVSRKEWKLISKDETKKRYVAFFEDDKGRLVVATWRLDGVEAQSSSTQLTGEDNHDANEPGGFSWLLLKVQISVAPTVDLQGVVSSESYGRQYEVGEIFQIKKDYKGKIHFVKKEALRNGDERSVVMDYTVQWPAPK